MLHELTLAVIGNDHLPSLALFLSLAIAQQHKHFMPPFSAEVLAVALAEKMLDEGKNCAAEFAGQPQQANSKDAACPKIESYVDPTTHDSRSPKGLRLQSQVRFDLGIPNNFGG